jgi:hypothetical protein
LVCEAQERLLDLHRIHLVVVPLARRQDVDRPARSFDSGQKHAATCADYGNQENYRDE